MQVRVRLASGLSRISGATFLDVALEDGATIADLYARLADTAPELSPALGSTLPVVGGEHAARGRVLEHRQEVALLLPVSGG